MATSRKLVIGFVSQAWSMHSTPQLSGVAQYVASHPELTLRDLRYRVNPQTPESLERGRPPWHGLADGVITSEGVERDAKETADWMLRGGVPVINLGADLRDPRVPCVHTSHDSIGRLAADHFLKCGISSFAVIGYALSYASPLRREAFRAALAAKGHAVETYDLKTHLEGIADAPGFEQKESGLLRLLMKARKPLGVLAINDSVGRAVCRVAGELGLAVPDEVAVLGVGNSELTWTQSPPLSSICTPLEGTGFTAAGIMHQILQGRPAPREPVQIAATELIARDSTLLRAAPMRELERALDFIRRHAWEAITVEHVLQNVTMSRRRFEQLFIAEVGRSPGQEIQRLRLARAEQLLKESDLPVSRIAAMVGYSETAAFSRFFKKHTGVTPAQRRRRG